MPMFYLSFSGEEGWRGAVYVRGRDFLDAVENTFRRGINPGGEVLGMALKEEAVALIKPGYVNRLLSKSELREAGPTTGLTRMSDGSDVPYDA